MLLLLFVLFVVGYLFIIFEHQVGINKAAIALLTGSLLWTLLFICSTYGIGGALPVEHFNHLMEQSLYEIASVTFFLLCALTIVELITVYQGFNFFLSLFSRLSKKKFFLAISIATFFLSSILDNLTSAVVMCSLVNTTHLSKKDKITFAVLIIVAANAGGIWSPIGDITTTMLWLQNRVTTAHLVQGLFLPSIISLIVPLLLASFYLDKENTKEDKNIFGLKDGAENYSQSKKNHQGRSVFILGMISLISVPFYKTVFGLPPYLGIILALALFWIIIHYGYKLKAKKENSPLGVEEVLSRIDHTTILFFLGILLAVTALHAGGFFSYIHHFSVYAKSFPTTFSFFVGVLSSILDNIPLLAALLKIYTLSDFPQNDYFWSVLTYAVGYGGSMLIIGSAAGVAVMGMMKINFFHYLKYYSVLILLGYLSGIALIKILLSN